jgi:nucleoside-diphosphate-sugar epimerase
MRILLTGATGYIGKRLLPVLLDAGHEVMCCVRDRSRFPTEGIYASSRISLLEVDFLGKRPHQSAVGQIDAAYYLIHSMSSGSADFDALE